ncbi:MAG: hypothetical protein O2968_22660 [Acidobacteria bacterium]|nr:hypothetical protein [Acidobacteriota bacterium]
MGRSTETQTFGDCTELDAPSGRQGGRAQIASSATLSWTAPGQRFYTQPAVAIDRSESGYGFRLQQPPAIGQRVQVDLPPARRYWGTVRHATWVNGAYKVGVEMDPEPLDIDE